MERSLTLRDELTAGILAGFAGGIVMELFYFLTTTVQGWIWSFRDVTAVLIGTSAFANPAAVPIGIVLHFCVSVAWALGYVYLMRSQPQLIARPWVSGAGFGLVVYVFMQLVLLTAGQYHRPSTPALLTIGLLAHIVFYGIPVALVASRLLRRA